MTGINKHLFLTNLCTVLRSNNMMDVKQLRYLQTQGRQLDFLFFWGHQPDASGKVSKSCLSQFYAAEFRVDGVRYPTAEHWMMAAKARLFGDRMTERAILEAAHPKKAKSLGRQVSGFESSVWERHAVEIVIEGNLAKFQQNRDLREYLLSTGDRILVEASPDDKIWGIGLHESDRRAGDPTEWPGNNLLGFADGSA